MIDLLEEDMLPKSLPFAFPRIVFAPFLTPTSWIRQLSTGETK